MDAHKAGPDAATEPHPAMAGSSQRSPYVGPRAYTEAEAAHFYGREHESRDLLALVVRERLVLFYAQSGAGKSSLLHARLIPGLRRQGFDVLPVARVSGEVPDCADPAAVGNLYAYNVILSLSQGLPEAERADPASLCGASLVGFLAGEDVPASAGEDVPASAGEDVPASAGEDVPASAGEGVPGLAGESLASSSETELLPGDVMAPDDTADQAAADLTPTVLIIDQFEEILTRQTEHWRERSGLFEQLREALERLPNLWVVLAMREDYVAALELYAELLPNRMRARFYMQRMGRDAALQAIEEPAASYGRPFAPGAAQTLVDDLARVHVAGQVDPQPGLYVEPVQLQVVCAGLWGSLPQNTSVITAQHLKQFADVTRALEAFYDRSVSDALREARREGRRQLRAGRAAAWLGSIFLEGKLRRWFEDPLITSAGTRGTVYQGETDTGGIPNQVVKALEDRHIIRGEWRAGGHWYELIHDRFIDPIKNANEAWEARRRHRRNLLVLAIGPLIALIAALVMLAWGHRLAQRERRIAATETAWAERIVAPTATVMPEAAGPLSAATSGPVASATEPTPTALPLTATMTSSPQPTDSPSLTATWTPAPTPTPMPTLAPAQAGTAGPTLAASSAGLLAPSPAWTTAPTASQSPALAPTQMATPTRTSTRTPTSAPTSTRTALALTSTPTSTPSATWTPAPTPTWTVPAPTETATPAGPYPISELAMASDAPKRLHRLWKGE